MSLFSWENNRQVTGLLHQPIPDKSTCRYLYASYFEARMIVLKLKMGWRIRIRHSKCSKMSLRMMRSAMYQNLLKGSTSELKHT